MTLGSDETSTSALHRSPKAQRENLVQWADYRGRNNSRGERELFGLLDSLLRPILKTRGPAKLLRLPLCEAALSPPHLSLCLGNFFSFFGKFASPPHPPVTGYVGVSRKKFPKKGKLIPRG